MPLVLLSADRAPQRIKSPDDNVARAQPGPAVIITSTEEGHSVAEAPIAEVEAPKARPLAYREPGGHWQEVGFEAADHWEQMTDELRNRLVADHLAPLDVDEFKVATNGGSASMITNNWVYSGSPRIYRIAGQLREFVTVLGTIFAAKRTAH